MSEGILHWRRGWNAYAAVRISRGDAPAPAVYVDPDGSATYRGKRYESRDAAFLAVQADPWFAKGVERKKFDKLRGADGSRLADPRWVDGSAAEDRPAVQGGQVTEESIDEMVANLSEIRRAPIVDGGGLGNTHASAMPGGDDTSAAGYVLGAVKVIGDDEDETRAHMFLYVALAPDVDRRVENIEIAYGSIAFKSNYVHPYSGEDIGTVLVSYALTNQSLQDVLEPHAQRIAVRAMALKGIVMSEKVTPPAKTADEDKGLAIERIADALQVDATDYEKMGDRLRALIDAHKAAQRAEEPDEAGKGDDGESGDEAADKGDEDTDPGTGERSEVGAADRMQDGDESEAGDDVMGAMLDEVRRISGDAELSAAGAIEILRALPELAKKPDDDAGLPGDDVEQKSEGDVGVDAERSEGDKGETLTRAIGDYIDERYSLIKRSPDAKDREDLAIACRALNANGNDWRAFVRRSIHAANEPPKGVVTSTNTRSGSGVSGISTRAEAIDFCKREIRKSDPRISSRDLRGKAYAMAKEKFREVFREDAS